MSKKQPTKATAPNVKTPHQVSNRNSSAATSEIKLSNKILIPAIIALFVALSMLYSKPLLEGMSFSSHDSNQYLALSKEVNDQKAVTGHVSMWSSRMFGGMPAYFMGGIDFPKAIDYTPRVLLFKIFQTIPDPALEIFFLMVCGFIGLYVLTRKISYSFLGAIAIGFCTYNLVSLDAGHITKVNTIAMFLPLFAGAWLLFRKKFIWGTILFFIFANEIVAERHVQIAYYSFILIGIYGIIEFVRSIQRKEVKQGIFAGLILVAAIAVSGMMNFDNYFVNDFSKDSTRGGDILHAAKMNPETATKTTGEAKKRTRRRI
jgi:hypothetical protein